MTGQLLIAERDDLPTERHPDLSMVTGSDVELFVTHRDAGAYRRSTKLESETAMDQGNRRAYPRNPFFGAFKQ